MQDVQHLTIDPFWTDVLGLFGTIGYVSSSLLTLVVRGITSESISGAQIFTTGLFTDLLPSANESLITVAHSYHRETDYQL